MSQPVRQGHRVLVSNEDAQRVQNRDAQELNITGARRVAEMVRTTLGPKGMDKLLVNTFGEVIITNDGATILDEMQIVSPAASMIAGLAISQQESASDGTTTTVAVAGELLKNAQELLDQDIHSTSIRHGFHTANEWARREIDAIADSIEFDPTDVSLLRRVAETSMTGKSTERHKDFLADLVVDAVIHVAESSDDGTHVDLDRVEIETQSGRPMTNSELLEGVVVNKDHLHDDMTTTVEDAQVMLLYKELEIDTGDVDTIELDEPGSRTAYLDSEQEELERQVQLIAETGANVVFFMRGVDVTAKYLLAKAGILGINRIKKSDLEEMREVLDGSPSPVWDLETATADDVGRGSVVRDEDAEQFYLTGDNSERVTLLLRGSTDHVVDEVERSVNDALHAVAQVVSDGRVLPGGGATEVELARRIRSAADSVSGREQLAIEAYADAIDLVPRMLAKNAGLDSIDVLAELRAAHHAGEVRIGLNAITGDLVDTLDVGIVEPARTKELAFDGATEVANMILNIDDVISAGDLTTEAEVTEEDLGGYEEDFDTPDMGGMIDPNDWGDF